MYTCGTLKKKSFAICTIHKTQCSHIENIVIVIDDHHKFQTLFTEDTYWYRLTVKRQY